MLKSGKKSLKKPSVEKEQTKELVQQIKTWQESKLGLKKLYDDLGKFTGKKRVEGRIKNEDLVLHDLITAYEEPIKRSALLHKGAMKIAVVKEKEAEEEEEVEAGLTYLKEKLPSAMDGQPTSILKALRAVDMLINKINRQMVDLRALYSSPLMPPIETEKKEEKKTPTHHTTP